MKSHRRQTSSIGLPAIVIGFQVGAHEVEFEVQTAAANQGRRSQEFPNSLDGLDPTDIEDAPWGVAILAAWVG